MTKLKRKRATSLHDNEENNFRKACHGVTKSGGNCCKPAAVNLGYTTDFCQQHRFQADGAPVPRTCDGKTLSGEQCTFVVPSAGAHQPSKPTFCRFHGHQAIDGGKASHTLCAGLDVGGIRCENFVTREPPYPQFCRQHQDQEKDMASPITELPDDVSTIILDQLEPVDRVAFALCNKDCANLVRSWGKRDRTPLHLSAASLKPLVINRILDWGDPLGDYPFVMSASTCPDAQQSDIEVYGFHNHTTRSEGEKDENGRFIIMPCECNSHMGQVPWESISPLYCIHNFFQYEWHRQRVALGAIDTRAPFLLNSSPNLGTCISCNETLVAPAMPKASFSHSTEQREEWVHPTSLCENCLPDTELYIRWCTACHGEPSLLVLARAYWTTQTSPPAGEQEEAEGETSTKKLKTAQNPKGIKNAQNGKVRKPAKKGKGRKRAKKA